MILRLTLLNLSLIVFPQMAHATERMPATTTEAVPQSVEEPAESPNLLGEYFIGWKENAPEGAALEVVYKGHWVHNISGGIEQKQSYLGNLDLRANFDLEQMAGVKGLSLSVYGLVNHGSPASEFVGDSFVSSNIEAPEALKLYEIYLKQNFGQHVSLLVGTRDLNADYNSLTVTGGLLNSAFGISPSFSQTGLNGPSIFPNTSLAANLKLEWGLTYVQTGYFNAVAGDPVLTGGTYINSDTELGFIHVAEAGQFSADDYKAGLGYWRYTQDAQHIDSETETSVNQGLYIIGEKFITSSVAIFFKYGRASDATNIFQSSTEAGVTIKGLVPNRTQDIVSLGYAHGESSTAAANSLNAVSSEAVIEVSYRYQVVPGFTVTPDFQYVQNPGLSNEMTDAFVGILGVEINLF